MSAYDRRVDPEVREVRRLEVITGALGRRRWSAEGNRSGSAAPAPTSSFDDRWLRDRQDKLSATLPVFLLLRNNLVRKVPCKNQQVIRLSL
jgi:hypothetical protein